MARGGKNRTKAALPESQKTISEFHALSKQIANETDPAKVKALKGQQEALGGLNKYQDASVEGAMQAGETSRFLVKSMAKLRDRKRIKLLDVGSIAGTAYEKWARHLIDCTSIDINSRAEKVIQADFMDFPAPSEPFDVVCLSLVLNFEGDISKRGQMLLRAHEFLKTEGFLYIVLPLSCVNNSRYLTHERFQNMLASCGFGKVIVQHDSPKLTYWLVQRTRNDGWDGVCWRKEEVLAGVKRNNFAILVKWQEEEADKIDGEEEEEEGSEDEEAARKKKKEQRKKRKKRMDSQAAKRNN